MFHDKIVLADYFLKKQKNILKEEWRHN